MKISQPRGWVVLLIAAGLAGSAGCAVGGDPAGTTGTTARPQPSSAAAPERGRASAPEVTAGLRRIGRLATDIAAATDTDQAHAMRLTEQLEPVWEPIEGTVKQNAPDEHLAMEGGLAVLKLAVQRGDAAAAARGATAVTRTVQEYLARYPG
jgi:phage tail sheath gpL-like